MNLGVAGDTTGDMLDNGILHVEFDSRTGCPKSIMKHGKQLLYSPCGMKVSYDDRGAWGETVWKEKVLGCFQQKSCKVVEANPMRAILRVQLTWERSEMRVDYILEKGSDILKLDIRLHNMEKHRQISLCVPVLAGKPDVRTETAFLAEHKISPWDSNTEHYQHRFADVSAEDGSGISVINDGVYACQQVGNEYRLLLSRSSVHARGGMGPLAEDLEHDFMNQGSMDYQIWLIGHEKAISNQRLFMEADNLHIPVKYLGDSCHAGTIWMKSGSLLEIKKKNTAVSCLKQSLENDKDLILRFFETEGKDGSLLIRYREREWEIDLTPYQIKTIKLTGEDCLECNLLEIPLDGKGIPPR